MRFLNNTGKRSTFLLRVGSMSNWTDPTRSFGVRPTTFNVDLSRSLFIRRCKPILIDYRPQNPSAIKPLIVPRVCSSLSPLLRSRARSLLRSSSRGSSCRRRRTLQIREKWFSPLPFLLPKHAFLMRFIVKNFCFYVVVLILSL